MDSDSYARLEARTQRLEREVRFFRKAAACAGLLLAAFIAFAAQKASDPKAGEVLRARGLIIEDENGAPRILLGAPVPRVKERTRTDPATGIVLLAANGADRMQLGAVGGPQMGGKLNPRVSPAVGLMVNDPSGDERAGFGVFENGQCGWGLDYPSQREAIIAAVMPDSGFAGIMLAADKEASAERALLMTSAAGETLLKFSDAKGRERATLSVGDKSPSLKILDESGQALSDLVTGKKP